jgi:hypothetical protein
MTIWTASTGGHHIVSEGNRSPAGTFAVIIGVSSYPHLGDGLSQKASETFGLGQLHVSALTAYDIFEWFRNRYDADAAAVECWLLLSPTAEELRVRPEMEEASAPATFENCKMAIRAWHRVMAELPPDAAAASRSMFFFSGHGIEIHQQQQILLPSDFLSPPYEAIDDCLATTFLVKGVSNLNVPHHIFFIDACRNDMQALRVRDIKASPILNQSVSAFSNPDLIAPVVFASAPGTAAYEYRTVERRSLFGAALLEGLGGEAGIELACDQDLCEVQLYKLHSSVKRRVLQMSEEDSRNTVRQRVVIGGVVDDLTVTKVQRPLVSMAPEVLEPTDSRYEIQALGTAWSFDPSDWTTGHELLGSEQLTDLFLNDVYATRMSRQPNNPSSLQEAGSVLKRTSRAEDNRSFVITVALPADPLGWWLTMPGREPGQRWAAVLPGDLEESVEYRLDLNFAYASGDGRRTVDGLEASIAVNTSDALESTSAAGLAAVAHAWWLNELREVDSGVNYIDETDLLWVLRDKLVSPLGATIAAHLLLEIESRLLPADWLAHLTSWFPGRPDPPVLAAEQARRTRDHDAFLGALETASERGLPHLAADIARLDVHLRDLALVGGSRESGVQAKFEPSLSRALRYLVPGGLFAVFHGPEHEISAPLLELG